MSNYCYEAVDMGGLKSAGTLEVADQGEALRRIREMGLFPTRVTSVRFSSILSPVAHVKTAGAKAGLRRRIFAGRVKSSSLAVFTRQLATVVEAGMPLLRGLRTLQEQESNAALKEVIGQVADAIESGRSLSEALSAHPRVFNRLYVNMAKAGEAGGALEITLRRLAEFMEKSRKIKGRIKAALFYPASVLVVASGIVWLLMVFIVPPWVCG